jgi:formate hydrogenlyase subunit 3/multisubunit Na+/H+ antiporter MnhD subunit
MGAILLAVAIQLAGGVAAWAASRRPVPASIVGAGAAVAGCLVAAPAAVGALLGTPTDTLALPWDATHGSFRIGLDPLSAFFLLPVLGLTAAAAVYGGNYLLGYRHTKSLGGPWFFFNAFAAGMTGVLVARTVLVFLVAWEVMSVAAFGLVTFEHEKPDVRRAGWVYLIATHLGVIFLFIVFLLLGRHAGSLEFAGLRAAPPAEAGWTGLIFVLAVIGFGAKAGFVPFHVWLPEAHPAAPSHVSALMSGVMIKMGVYGILRVLTFLGPPAAWFGPVLAALGLTTALVGIALAVHQRDLKRVLAYSSIENMGLIALGLGVALWGWTGGQPAVAVLAMTAALLHVWNHALMKGLMFLAAGSVLHATGTTDLERLGGLMRRMPWTGRLMTLGAVAVAALPPLNGFVSKWLVYMSLLDVGLVGGRDGRLPALLTVGVLALIGGLAAFTFVRAIGLSLLGTPRGEAAVHAHESSAWMLGPMVLLAALCVVLAVMPGTISGLLDGPVAQILGPVRDDVTVANIPAGTIGLVNAVVLVAGVIGTAGFVWLIRSRSAAGPTWGCGYVRPTARMQYTGRSFAEMLAENLMPRSLRPRTARRAPEGLFPTVASFSADSSDPVTSRIYEPFFRRWADRFALLRVLQQGKVHVYLVYILVTVVVSLAWASARTWLRGPS